MARKEVIPMPKRFVSLASHQGKLYALADDGSLYEIDVNASIGNEVVVSQIAKTMGNN
jgi:hypothetical protein